VSVLNRDGSFVVVQMLVFCSFLFVFECCSHSVVFLQLLNAASFSISFIILCTKEAQEVFLKFFVYVLNRDGSFVVVQMLVFCSFLFVFECCSHSVCSFFCSF
jgi:hypothetical protein